MEPITICLWALFALVLIASHRWAAAADRCHALKQELKRAEGRIDGLQYLLRCHVADIERLGSQVSALSNELEETHHDHH
jgi:DNA repair ATPase RecN